MLGDEIAISYDDLRVFCRPTLRAAMNLNRHYGLTNLLDDVVQGSLSAIRVVIETTAAGLDIAAFIDVAPLQQVMSTCQSVAYSLLLAMTGAD